MKRPTRFVRPADLYTNNAYSKILEITSRYKADQLRSEKSAVASCSRLPRSSLRARKIYREFAGCLTENGYDDAIGFACGRHQESAACNYCRFIARVRVVELFLLRPAFRKDCTQLTIVDTENEFPTTELHQYDQDLFRQRLRRIASDTSGEIVAVGQFEYQVVCRDARKTERIWSPHIHLVLTGNGRDEFIQKVRSEFVSARPNSRPVLAQSLPNEDDVLRAAVYQFKSSYVRKKSGYALNSGETLELREFLLNKSCSDLMFIHGVNFRNARVEIASQRELAIWADVQGFLQLAEPQIQQRIIPTIDYSLRRTLFDEEGNLLWVKALENIEVITEQFTRTKQAYVSSGLANSGEPTTG